MTTISTAGAAGTAGSTAPAAGFRHEAMFYQGMREFLEGATAFLREGIHAGEPALVVVSADKIDALRRELGDEATGVRFADMADVGRNPARIIPAWQDFVDEHLREDWPVRGIGEPIFPQRSAAELIECQGHETLLNVAFDGGPGWRLLCPYDTAALPADVLDEAQRSHPYLRHNDTYRSSDTYVADHPSPARWDQPLAAAPAGAAVHIIGEGAGSLADLRTVIRRHCADMGFATAHTGSLVVAVSEMVTNALVHGGGTATVRLWIEGATTVCDISDTGRLDIQPLAGRQLPTTTQPGGRGLWLANQLCDLVQVRSGPSGTTVRVHLTGDTTV